MLQNGILNPDLLHLVSRIRHTNTLVICDWAFPYWTEIETVDLALVKGIPTVLDVLEALKPNFNIGAFWQAEEFLAANPPDVIAAFDNAFGDIPVTREPHRAFKERVPRAVGLVRTGDPTAYGNIILESV